MAEFIYTGNEVDVYVAGVKLDLVQSIRGSDDYGMDPVSGIGDIKVREHVPAVARHNISISKFALRNESAIKLGIIHENGDAAMRGKTFAIEIFSKQGPLIRKWENCVNGGGDVSVNAHRTIVSDATFLATDARGTYASQ